MSLFDSFFSSGSFARCSLDSFEIAQMSFRTFDDCQVKNFSNPNLEREQKVRERERMRASLRIFQRLNFNLSTWANHSNQVAIFLSIWSLCQLWLNSIPFSLQIRIVSALKSASTETENANSAIVPLNNWSRLTEWKTFTPYTRSRLFRNNGICADWI